MTDLLSFVLTTILALCFLSLVFVMGMAGQFSYDKESITKQFCQPKCAQGEVASVDKQGERFICSCTYSRVEK